MSIQLQIGASLLAFSPGGALSLVLFRRPQLAIISLAAAAFWLASIVCISIFWAMMSNSGPGKFGGIAILSSVIQFCFRFLFIRFYRNTETLIKESSPSSNDVLPLNDKSSSISAGLGFGIMHSLVFCGTVIASSNSSGQYFSESCPTIPLVLQLSVTALCFFVLDVALMCIAFVANKTKSYSLYFIVGLLQLVASLTSLSNLAYFGCRVSLTLLSGVVCTAAGFVFWIWPLLTRATAIRQRSKGSSNQH
jgi:anterior pharynx defective protein 1